MLRGGVGVPESAGGGGLRANASLFDVSVEVVSADAPFLADLVGLQVATPDPVANGLLLDLSRSASDSLYNASAAVATAPNAMRATHARALQAQTLTSVNRVCAQRRYLRLGSRRAGHSNSA